LCVDIAEAALCFDRGMVRPPSILLCLDATLRGLQFHPGPRGGLCEARQCHWPSSELICNRGDLPGARFVARALSLGARLRWHFRTEADAPSFLTAIVLRDHGVGWADTSLRWRRWRRPHHRHSNGTSATTASYQSHNPITTPSQPCPLASSCCLPLHGSQLLRLQWLLLRSLCELPWHTLPCTRHEHFVWDLWRKCVPWPAELRGLQWPFKLYTCSMLLRLMYKGAQTEPTGRKPILGMRSAAQADVQTSANRANGKKANPWDEVSCSG